jgi:hypothetical protein
VALIDLDNVHQGSPWQDIGSFVASLLYRGLLMDTPGQVVRETIATFYRAYERNAPWRTSPETLYWFVAAALLHERAFRCVTRLKDGRLDLVDKLVTLAAHISEGIEGSSLVSPANPLPDTLWARWPVTTASLS